MKIKKKKNESAKEVFGSAKKNSPHTCHFIKS